MDKFGRDLDRFLIYKAPHIIARSIVLTRDLSDNVFGERLISARSFLVSAFISIISIGVFAFIAIILFTLRHGGFGDARVGGWFGVPLVIHENPIVSLFLTPNWHVTTIAALAFLICASVCVDYASAIQTRFLIRFVRLDHGIFTIAFFMCLDVVASILLFTLGLAFAVAVSRSLMQIFYPEVVEMFEVCAYDLTGLSALDHAVASFVIVVNLLAVQFSGFLQEYVILSVALWIDDGKKILLYPFSTMAASSLATSMWIVLYALSMLVARSSVRVLLITGRGVRLIAWMSSVSGVFAMLSLYACILGSILIWILV